MFLTVFFWHSYETFSWCHSKTSVCNSFSWCLYDISRVMCLTVWIFFYMSYSEKWRSSGVEVRWVVEVRWRGGGAKVMWKKWYLFFLLDKVIFNFNDVGNAKIIWNRRFFLSLRKKVIYKLESTKLDLKRTLCD